jgi:hypothetical protein
VLFGDITTGAAVIAALAAVISGPQGKACTRTNPEYMITAGGANVSYMRGSVGFDTAYAGVPYQTWEDPYLTVGYNNSTNTAWQCGGIPHSSAYSLPVRVGKQGHITASVHDITGPDFSGNSGFDIWFTPSPSDTSYNQMANGGNKSTEIMIWLSHPSLGGYSPSKAVKIDGYKWNIAVGLASQGHGAYSTHPNGWNVVNFESSDLAHGEVKVHNLVLNTFMSYAINHGWLQPHDYLMAINQGFEIRAGHASVRGYTLTGVK